MGMTCGCTPSSSSCANEDFRCRCMPIPASLDRPRLQAHGNCREASVRSNWLRHSRRSLHSRGLCHSAMCGAIRHDMADELTMSLVPALCARLGVLEAATLAFRTCR